MSLPSKKTASIGPETAEEAGERLGLSVISVNKIIQEEINNKTPVGEEILNHFKSSLQSNPFLENWLDKRVATVPDDVLLALVQSRIRSAQAKMNGWILEGFPQTLLQFGKLMGTKNAYPHCIIYMHLHRMDIQRNLHSLVMNRMNGATYLPNQTPKGQERELEPADEDTKERLLGLSKSIDELVQQAETFRFSKFVRIEGGISHFLC